MRGSWIRGGRRASASSRSSTRFSVRAGRRAADTVADRLLGASSGASSATRTCPAPLDGQRWNRRRLRGAAPGEVLAALHNPAYAGTYAYGRHKHTIDLDGHHHSRTKPQAEWTVLIADHHPGYLTWAQFQHNQHALAANAAARSDQPAKGPAREGPALLQGLAICGRCGHRMSVGYHKRAGLTVPDYHCRRESIANAVPASFIMLWYFRR